MVGGNSWSWENGLVCLTWFESTEGRVLDWGFSLVVRVYLVFSCVFFVFGNYLDDTNVTTKKNKNN